MKRIEKRGREYWERQVKGWKSSGQTQREYCKSKKLSYWSLRNWSRDLSSDKKVKKTRRRKFSQLKVVDKLLGSEMGYELTLGTGETLRFSRDCDASHVAELVSALRS